MKRTHKRFLGLLGLFLVAAMTAFAAAIPIPGAKATSSVTDTITVTVISSTIQIQIVDPTNGTIYVTPGQSLSIDQEHAARVVVTGKYTDPNGNETTFGLADYNPTEIHSSDDISIDLSNYGYGSYYITAIGTNSDGVEYTDFVEFQYLPITGTTDDSGDDEGEVFVDLDYEVGAVCSADINIFQGNTLITPPSTIHVDAPTTHVQIPVDNLETGDYSVVTTAYDCPNPGEDPQPLPLPYTDTFHHEKEEEIPVPDTGSFFMGLNISKTDYLVTALIVFFAFSLLSLGIVLKGKKNNKRR